MRDGNPLTLHHVDTIRQDGQEQVGDAVVQQVDLVDVQDSPMGLGQESRLEYRLSLLHGSLDIHRSNQSILGNAQRDLDEGRVPDLCRRLSHRGQLLRQTVLPLVRVGRVRVANAPLDHLDGREQRVDAPRHDGLGRSPPSRDGNAPELIVHRSEQKRLLDMIHSHHFSQRIRALHAHRLGAHVGRLVLLGLQLDCLVGSVGRRLRLGGRHGANSSA